MAQSMKSEGVIEPIEIDENNMIICGEMRWRAATLAKLETIPCTVNKTKLEPMERLLRQCVENAHHSDMNIIDTARAWKSILVWHEKQVGGGRIERFQSMWLAKKLGKPPSAITRTLALLKEEPYIIKILERNEAPWSLVQEARHPDKKIANILKQRVLSGEISNKEHLRLAIKAIKKHPERIQEILNCISPDGIRDLLRTTALVPYHEKTPKTFAEASFDAITYVARATTVILDVQKNIVPNMTTKGKEMLKKEVTTLQSTLEEINSIL